MRQSAAEIDHAILDVAAGIFATFGFAHASVQQIADAVGYSKPGLLHRFGSKEALYRAVLDEVSRTLEGVVTHATDRAGRPAQVPEVFELVTRKALARPGMVQLMLVAFEPSSVEPGMRPVQAAGRRLVEAFDPPLSGPAARLRMVLALQLVVTGAVTQHSPVADLHVDPGELVPMLVGLATEVMRAADGVPAA